MKINLTDVIIFLVLQFFLFGAISGYISFSLNPDRIIDSECTRIMTDFVQKHGYIFMAISLISGILITILIIFLIKKNSVMIKKKYLHH